jgi:hypothetical protein
MSKKNSRDSSKLKVFSPLQLLCNLSGSFTKSVTILRLTVRLRNNLNLEKIEVFIESNQKVALTRDAKTKIVKANLILRNSTEQ